MLRVRVQAPLLLYDIHYDGVEDWTPEPRHAATIHSLWAEQQRAHLLYAQHGPETRSFAPTLTEYVF